MPGTLTFLPPTMGEAAETTVAGGIGNQTFTVPTGDVWYLQSFKCLLATDANVADRRMAWQFADSGGNVVARCASTVLQTASLNWTYVWSVGGELALSIIGTVLPLRLPRGFWCVGGGSFTTLALNLQATDLLSAFVLTYQRWRA